MKHMLAQLEMTLLSDTIFSSGNSIPGGVDITLRTDHLGRPYLPGSTVKGLLREHLGNYLCWTGGSREDLDQLLGCRGVRPVESRRRLVFGDLRLKQEGLLEKDCAYRRTFTRLENGAAAAGSLHSALCLPRGHVLTGQLVCAEEDAQLLTDAFGLIQSVGLKRSRGFGSVSVTFRKLEEITDCAPVSEGHWVHYRLRLKAPLAITRGTSAPTDKERENHSDGLTHIPGSAIRGMILSRLAETDPEWLEANKAALMQRVIFRSAFPMYEKGEEVFRQIPTPLGFYEDREKTKFYHVLGRDVDHGHKRARLGHYCRISDGKLLHSTPAMESSMRITQTDPDTRQLLAGQDRKMFSSDAIAADTLMEGWIYTPDPALAPRISSAFRSWFCLGADRYGGSGLCRVEYLQGDAPDPGEFCYREGDGIPKTLCMLLLTPTALSCDGEVCSLSDEQAAELLGVSGARVLRYATSVLPYSGFNRKWGCALPTVNMYAPGSVFLIECSEAPSLERLRELELQGIGIRRSEGFGQVLFPRSFLEISSHAELDRKDQSYSRDLQVRLKQRRARYTWLLNHSIEGNLSASQCGYLQNLCQNVLQGLLKQSALTEFFEKKKNQTTQDQADYAVAEAQYRRIMSDPMYEELGCYTQEERLALYCELFGLSRKEDKA